MPPVRSIGRTVTRPHASVRGVDPAADLAGLEAAQWEIIDREMRQTMLISIDTRYKQYLDNFYETSKLCVRRHDGCVRNHRMWRYIAIIGTGVLACVNILAARRSIVTASSNVVPILASILALLLAVLANLETLANSAEKAQAYRESRELYLDAAEEYDRAWSVTVVPLGDTSQAYANAVELYRRIVAADRDLRRSFKELTKQK